MRYLPIVAKMAFRNVLKYGRRSLETFAVIFVGIAAVALADTFMNGFSDRLVASFAVADGHLRVSAPGYEARRAICPLDKLVPEPDSIASRIESAAKEAASRVGEGFSAMAFLPVIRAACALQLGDRSANVYVAGAEATLPNHGLAPPFRDTRFVEGRFPRPGERGMALSSEVASALGARSGDLVIVLASDAYGSFGAVELPLLGVTKGDPGPEACLIDLAAMRELVGVESAASVLALYLVDSSGAPVDPRDHAGTIRAMEAEARSAGLDGRRWDSSGSLAAPILAFFDSFAYVCYAIFVLVAGTGIANSILLSVQDRMRDFATLRAVAFTARWVKAIVALETLAVGAAASLAGVSTVWIASALSGGGMRMPQSIRGITDWMPEVIGMRVDPAALALIFLAGCALPLLAAAYPLHVLGRMKIREALGYT